MIASALLSAISTVCALSAAWSSPSALVTAWAEGVGSMEVKGNGKPGAVAWTEQGGQVEIAFDLIEGIGGISGGGRERVTYEVVYCNEDRQPSDLQQSEYMQGFQGLTVDDMESGRGATVSYTHYRLSLPNNDVELRLSGNYAVHFRREDGQWLATACFCLSEELVAVRGTVTGNTLVDTYGGSQQLDFSIETGALGRNVSERDIRVTVYKNGRHDDAVRGLRPSGMAAGRLDYVNLRPLIFAAGNEYRRFEFLSHRGRGMRVESIGLYEGLYHVTLMTDKPHSAYLYDRDLNGGFLVNCLYCHDPATEADYHFVHFSLASPLLPKGDVYIGGAFCGQAFDERNRMYYNAERGCYEHFLLLKQGQYNYEYLFQPYDAASPALTAPLEGDFYQTENDYTVYVYYRPFGARHDRLVAVAAVR
jgi:hypothetical protein